MALLRSLSSGVAGPDAAMLGALKEPPIYFMIAYYRQQINGRPLPGCSGVDFLVRGETACGKRGSTLIFSYGYPILVKNGEDMM